MSNGRTEKDDELLKSQLGQFISQLEHDLLILKQNHGAEMETFQKQNSLLMSETFLSQLKLTEQRISELKEEIEFLKEVNQSQRIMMETNLEYLKAVEAKVKKDES